MIVLFTLTSYFNCDLINPFEKKRMKSLTKNALKGVKKQSQKRETCYDLKKNHRGFEIIGINPKR